jgi:XTP/dITP diphosphohydrolase
VACRGVRIRVATRNAHKLAEIAEILRPYGIQVEALGAEKVEVQDDDVANIARRAAEILCSQHGDCVVVEDTGLYIKSLGGFPGPYAEYAYRTVGLRGILRLLEGSRDREAAFRCAVAVCVGGSVHVFVGEARGWIAREPRGSAGFGYDPVFVPEGESRTYAELGGLVKNRVSHRARAFTALAKFLLESCKCGERTT